MALVRCKECNEEISSSSASCPRCGAKRPDVAEKSAAVAVFGLLALVGIVWFLSSQGSADTKPVLTGEAQLPSAATAAVVDDTPLTAQQTGKIFSDYVGEIQTKLVAAGMIGTLYGSKIRQDAAYGNLEAMRSDAEKLKTMLMSEQDDLSKTLAADGNYTDKDAEYFGAVIEGAQSLLSDQIEIAVDVAVQANYGMHDDGDIGKISRELKRKRKDLDTAILDGYRHFGYSRDQVDMSTMTLKPAANTVSKPGSNVPKTAL